MMAEITSRNTGMAQGRGRESFSGSGLPRGEVVAENDSRPLRPHCQFAIHAGNLFGPRGYTNVEHASYGPGMYRRGSTVKNSAWEAWTRHGLLTLPKISQTLDAGRRKR